MKNLKFRFPRRLKKRLKKKLGSNYRIYHKLKCLNHFGKVYQKFYIDYFSI